MGFDEEKEIFSGTKRFWRTGTTVDYKLLYHKDHNVTELIMEVSDKKINIPRIYFNTSLLSTKFGENCIRNKIDEMKKDNTLKRFNSPEEFREGALDELAAAFIEKRLTILSEGRGIIRLINFLKAFFCVHSTDILSNKIFINNGK